MSLLTIVLAYPLIKDRDIVAKNPLIGRFCTLLKIANTCIFGYD
jgi:hypothetical protein